MTSQIYVLLWGIEDITTATSKSVGPTNIIRNIPIESIRPDPEQPRKTFDAAALREMANSIDENGLLQPISVRQDPANPDGYLIIAGERRYRAHLLLEAPTIKAIVFNADEERATRLQLVENLNRQDLNPAEEYHAYRKLADAGVTLAEIARITSKGVAHFTVCVQISRNGSPMLLDLLAKSIVNRWTAWQVREPRTTPRIRCSGLWPTTRCRNSRWPGWSRD